MSESDAVPLPREGEVFFDVRGAARSMRLSWYAESRVAVFSIWQGDRCTATFRLPFADLARMVQTLEDGPQPRPAGIDQPGDPHREPAAMPYTGSYYGPGRHHRHSEPGWPSESSRYLGATESVAPHQQPHYQQPPHQQPQYQEPQYLEPQYLERPGRPEPPAPPGRVMPADRPDAVPPRQYPPHPGEHPAQPGRHGRMPAADIPGQAPYYGATPGHGADLYRPTAQQAPAHPGSYPYADPPVHQQGDYRWRPSDPGGPGTSGYLPQSYNENPPPYHRTPAGPGDQAAQGTAMAGPAQNGGWPGGDDAEPDTGLLPFPSGASRAGGSGATIRY